MDWDVFRREYSAELVQFFGRDDANPAPAVFQAVTGERLWRKEVGGLLERLDGDAIAVEAARNTNAAA